MTHRKSGEVALKKMRGVAGSYGTDACMMGHSQSDGSSEMSICGLRPSRATYAKHKH